MGDVLIYNFNELCTWRKREEKAKLHNIRNGITVTTMKRSTPKVKLLLLSIRLFELKVYL